MLTLESLLERQQEAGAHPGDTDAGGSRLGSLSHHEDTGAGKHRSGALSLVYQHGPQPQPAARQLQCRDTSDQADGKATDTLPRRGLLL